MFQFYCFALNFNGIYFMEITIIIIVNNMYIIKNKLALIGALL